VRRESEVGRSQREGAGEGSPGAGEPLLLGERVRQIEMDVRRAGITRERVAQQGLGGGEVAPRERTLTSREAASGAVERKVPPHASRNRFYCRVAATKGASHERIRRGRALRRPGAGRPRRAARGVLGGGDGSGRPPG